MIRRVLLILTIVAVIAVAAFLLYRYGIPGGGEKPLIAESPVVLQSVKRINRLFTQEYYQEHVENLVEEGQVMLVMIVRGRILAGVDLKDLSEKDILISGDTIRLQLPAPAVLETIINPSQVEIFDQKKKFSTERVNALKKKAGENLVKQAIERGLLTRATRQLQTTMTEFLSVMGFRRVEIVFPVQPSG